MFKALFSSRRESCIHPASFSKCYGVYDLNKKYQSLETPKEKSEKRGKEPGLGGTQKEGWVGVHVKVPVRNIKNKHELLMYLVCLLVLVAGRSRTIISAMNVTQ